MSTPKNLKWQDRGLKAVAARIAKLARHKVEIGLVGAAAEATHPNAKISVADVGLINEFGSDDGHVPERRFMRQLTTEGDPENTLMRARLNAGTAAVFKQGADPINVLHTVGAAGVRLMQANILAHPAPANAAATIKKKGFDGSLIETDTLLNAVSYRIVQGLRSEDATITAVHDAKPQEHIESGAGDAGVARAFEAFK